MVVNVYMPRLGGQMEEGTVSEWLVSEGDKVEQGQEIAEISTNKITNPIEAQVTGTLSKILVQEDEEVEVGTVIAEITVSDE